MSQSEIIENPVTICAVRIDGKKLTKSLFYQLEARSIVSDLYGYRDDIDLDEVIPNLKEFGGSIFARHSFEIEPREEIIHFIWYHQNELFTDSLDEQNNLISNQLCARKSNIDYYQQKLDIARQFLSSGDIDFNCWDKILEPAQLSSAIEVGDNLSIPLTKNSLLALAKISEDLSKVEHSQYKDLICLTKINFNKYMKNNPDELSALKKELEGCFTGIVNKLPMLIERELDLYNEILPAYEELVQSIKSAPKILIGA